MQIQLNIYANVLYILCSVHVIYAQRNCSEFIKFVDNDDFRVGKFEISLGQSMSDNYVEVKVYVSDICQGSLCAIAIATDVEIARWRYKSGQPVPYNIYFRGASKNAWVKAVVLKGSNDCSIICEHEKNTVDSRTKSMKHALHIDGEFNSHVIPCDPWTRPVPTPNSGEVPCGTPLSNTLSVNSVGRLEAGGSWPWLAAIKRFKYNDMIFICAGTVISKRVILTAAHCFYDRGQGRDLLPNEVFALLGQLNLYYFGPEPVKYYTHNIIRHPEYRPSWNIYNADIALLITEKDIAYSYYIRPACIWDGPEDENLWKGEVGTVVGWVDDKNLSDNNYLPKLLEITTVSYDVCANSYLEVEGNISCSNFCASPCQGDSGSGFFIKESNSWKIRGITSNTKTEGDDMCDMTNYVVYTDVASFKDWINEETEKL